MWQVQNILRACPLLPSGPLTTSKIELKVIHKTWQHNSVNDYCNETFIVHCFMVSKANLLFMVCLHTINNFSKNWLCRFYEKGNSGLHDFYKQNPLQGKFPMFAFKHYILIYEYKISNVCPFCCARTLQSPFEDLCDSPAHTFRTSCFHCACGSVHRDVTKQHCEI